MLRLAFVKYGLNVCSYNPALYAAKTLLLIGNVQNHNSGRNTLFIMSLGHKQCDHYKMVHLQA